MRRIVIAFLFPLVATAQYDGNTTPNYDELIAQYHAWDQAHEEILLLNMGKSDTEFPIYLCLINAGKDSAQAFENARRGTTVLINNAIHPGEPDGVNASLIWIQQWIKGGKKTKELPIIAIIPAYNIGGMYNRSSTSRANQDGPEEYGFRGNAQNLDLNRDFIKMDSENAKTFAAIFQALEPDVFVDNHVSNGADYQYTLTLITAMKERLAPSQRALTYDVMLPEITKTLHKSKVDWCPYVDTKAATPDSGLVAFNDLPRYAMGYARLFNALSFTVETHMLKPFPERVQANLKFMEVLFVWTGKNAATIEKARKDAVTHQLQSSHYAFNYRLNENTYDQIEFKGYKAAYKTSEVTGLERLYYDRTVPYTRQIPYYNSYSATDSVAIPQYYIVSAEAKSTIEKLRQNGVKMECRLERDDQQVSTVRIESMNSSKNPYEGHYLHNSVQTFERKETVEIPKGSYVVWTQQDRRLFIVSVLEPKCEDSYFAWNFMDSYVQEKEYFSDYVFEDKAAEILKNDPELKAEFEQKKAQNSEFAKDAWAQLFFIYKKSAYFESSTFNRLPVFKVY